MHTLASLYKHVIPLDRVNQFSLAELVTLLAASAACNTMSDEYNALLQIFQRPGTLELQFFRDIISCNLFKSRTKVTQRGCDPGIVG